MNTAKRMMIAAVAALAMSGMTGLAEGVAAGQGAGRAWSQVPAVPRGAVAAAVVDVQKVVSGATGVLDLLRSAMPQDLCQPLEELDKEIKDVKSELELKGVPLDGLEWVMVAVGALDGRAQDIKARLRQLENVGIVLCMKDTSSVAKFLKSECDAKAEDERVASAEVMRVGSFHVIVASKNLVVVVPGKYDRWDKDKGAIYIPDEQMLKLFVRTCRGYGDADKSFETLADLHGDVCARAIVPAAGKLVSRLGLSDVVADAARRSGDDELFNTVTELGDLVVDLRLGPEAFGVKASLTMATEKDAELVHGFLTASHLLWRAALDAGMIAFSYNFEEIEREVVRMGFPDVYAAKLERVARAVRKCVDGALQAGRTGKTVSISLSIPLRKGVEAVAGEFRR